MENRLKYEKLPSKKFYRAVYASYERELERRGGVYSDVMNRLRAGQPDTRKEARRTIAAYTINLFGSEPSEGQLSQHRAFIAGFSQSVEIGYMLFKSDEYTELNQAKSMEQLIRQAHTTCVQTHPEYVGSENSPLHFSHAFAHLGESGAEIVGDRVLARLNAWGEQAYPLHLRNRTGFVLGHLVTAVTVERHQSGINDFVNGEYDSDES